jgi:hypothetical protein
MDDGSTLLHPEQWRSLMDVTTRPATRIPLAIVGGTGIWGTEFLHLHEDWIEWPGERPDEPSNPIIRIPENEECRRKEVPQGHNSSVDIIERDQPCQTCRSNSQSNDLRSRFRSPRGESTPNIVPVVDEEAINALKWWFNQYDTIPWHHNYNVLNTEARQHLDRSEKINHTSLRRTFVARATKMGLDLDLIADSLGVRSRQLKEKGRPFTIIAKQFGDYEHVSYTHRNFQDYLMVLHTIGPASTSQIADALGLTYKAVQERMPVLAEMGFMKEVGNTDHGGSLWEAIVSPDTELKCRDTQCERTFDTRRGRSTHETVVHGD